MTANQSPGRPVIEDPQEQLVLPETMVLLVPPALGDRRVFRGIQSQDPLGRLVTKDLPELLDLQDRQVSKVQPVKLEHLLRDRLVRMDRTDPQDRLVQ